MAAFPGAFTVFSLLAGDDLICPVALVGWTASGPNILGLDVWQSSLSFNTLQVPSQKDTEHKLDLPELEQFAALPEASDFPLSAIFEVVTTNAKWLKLSGSPVVIDRARTQASENVDFNYVYPKSSRAPTLRIEGQFAEKMARAAICDYSNYVAHVFDNFDRFEYYE